MLNMSHKIYPCSAILSHREVKSCNYNVITFSTIKAKICI